MKPYYQDDVSDMQLSALVALYVCGMDVVSIGDDLLNKEMVLKVESKPGCYAFQQIAPYSTSADAVLAIMDGLNWQANHYAGDDVVVSVRPDTILSDAVGEWYEAQADTFPRAACLALLKAAVSGERGQAL